MPEGRIATFFSFKGGVGRTMALANCAFIAAMQGQRVLVMDWDLEAPGLPYYFRGLIDQKGAGEIRKAPGVLDLFWGWRQAVDGARNSADLSDRVARYRKHDAFRNCVNPLVEARRLPGKARLDVITAGAAKIRGPEVMSYAEALSRFNWSQFFEKSAGGNLIHELTRWCRANYDLVLIDSRTGLADVAGICTMQIPDTVYLNFVFNRQNIDGSAQVARSILGARGNEVDVRVIPMRVSKDRPTEEADARARASREFRRAGLNPQRVEDDLAALSVPASSAVPYYEALAAFTSSDSTAGDLNWAYKKLTQELLGIEIAPLKLDPKWNEEVRARLQPDLTTTDYLRELSKADPDRALDEVTRYLDGALHADPSLEIEPDYVRALVAATIDVFDRVWQEDETAFRLLEKKALNLIEQMHALGEGDLRIDFVDAVEEFGFHIVHSPEEDKERLQRQEKILSMGPQDGEMLHRRTDTAIKLARFAFDADESAQALDYATAAEDLIEEATQRGGHVEEARYLHASVADIRARVALNSDSHFARKQFRRLLELAEGTPDVRLRFLAADAHMTLADMATDALEQREHLLAALAFHPRRILGNIDRIGEVVKIALDSEQPLEMALHVGTLLFGEQRLARSVPFGRDPAAAIRFMRLANQLVRALSDASPAQTAPIFAGINDAAARVLANWTRRKSRHVPIDADLTAKFLVACDALFDRLQQVGLPVRQLGKLRDLLSTVAAEDEDVDEDGDHVA